MDELLPYLHLLYNTALSERFLLASQKQTVLLSSLKCCSLDVNDMANYRPVPNLSFLSKIVELMQLICYSLPPKQQLGFKKFHSTLLKHILADILGAVDQGQVTLFTLLDVCPSALLTTAFYYRAESLHASCKIDIINEFVVDKIFEKVDIVEWSCYGGLNLKSILLNKMTSVRALSPKLALVLEHPNFDRAQELFHPLCQVQSGWQSGWHLVLFTRRPYGGTSPRKIMTSSSK